MAKDDKNLSIEEALGSYFDGEQLPAGEEERLLELLECDSELSRELEGYKAVREELKLLFQEARLDSDKKREEVRPLAANCC